MSAPGAVAAPSPPRANLGEPWSGLLKDLDEPVGMLAELRAAASEEPAAVRSAAPRLLGAYAAEVWADQLDDLGVSAAGVTHAFASFRREIWLWVEGDRRWEQLAGSLAARVLRRVAT